MPAAVVSRTERDPEHVRIGVLRKAKAYVALTKPRVIELLLITTAPVMVLAADTWTAAGI
jgi:protoheme IX farnesyltransferase